MSPCGNLHAPSSGDFCSSANRIIHNFSGLVSAVDLCSAKIPLSSFCFLIFFSESALSLLSQASPASPRVDTLPMSRLDWCYEVVWGKVWLGREESAAWWEDMRDANLVSSWVLTSCCKLYRHLNPWLTPEIWYYQFKEFLIYSFHSLITVINYTYSMYTIDYTVDHFNYRTKALVMQPPWFYRQLISLFLMPSI